MFKGVYMTNITELFIGRLGRKPDLRYTLKTEPVCYLAVAVNKELNQKATWKRVIVNGRQAELCNLYLKKGSDVFVQGQKIMKLYEGKDGVKRSIEEVEASLVGFSNV
jgi:single-strand DNA-binding protein